MNRLARGFSSFVSIALHPLGPYLRGRVAGLCSADRLARGVVFVLPGIEGESLLNHDVALGLNDGGVDLAIEIFDWTTGCFLLAPWHLRSRRRHAEQALRLASRIAEYRRQHPGCPVHLIGHSGGGAMVIQALEQLPPTESVATAILLAAAISPEHDLRGAISRTERGIWNFSSRGDWLFLGLGTLLFGSLDGRHTVCAGARGFSVQSAGPHMSTATRLHEVPWTWNALGQFHLGGHLGCTNRVYVAETIAPIVRSRGPA